MSKTTSEVLYNLGKTKNSRKHLMQRRFFLNERAGLAAAEVQAVLETTIRPNKAPTHYVDAYLELSDCSRKVTLDFHAFDSKELTSRIKKVDKLIGLLMELQDSLLIAQTIVDEHHKEFEGEK